MSSVATADEMKNPTGAQVCLILGLALILAASVVGLAAMDKDVGSIFAAVGAVLITVAGAFGWAKATAIQKDVNHVKELSNGRITDLMESNKQLQDKVTAMAMMMVPPKQDEDAK
jgi:flagellar motor component MotA